MAASAPSLDHQARPSRACDATSGWTLEVSANSSGGGGAPAGTSPLESWWYNTSAHPGHSGRSSSQASANASRILVTPSATAFASHRASPSM